MHIGTQQKKESENSFLVGKIDYFEKFTGTGFIVQADGTKITFSNWRTTYPVKEGDIVIYQLERAARGWHAVDITKKP